MRFHTHSFNPLIVVAYSVTEIDVALAGNPSTLFQSPDCRGVFRHLFKTLRENAKSIEFQSPDCRGVFRHLRASRHWRDGAIRGVSIP